LAGESLAFIVAESEIERYVADPDREAGAQADGFENLSVELDAIRRSHIPEAVAPFHAFHDCVANRNRRAVHHDVVLAAAAEGHALAVKLEAIGLGIPAGDGDDNAGHIREKRSLRA